MACEGLKVLAVDDEALILMDVSYSLEQMGHEPVEASSAEKALDYLRSGGRVDLLITDLALGGMSGADLIRTVSKEWPGLPMICATGYSAVQGASKDLPVLSKPFSDDQLRQAIETAVPAARETRVPAIV